MTFLIIRLSSIGDIILTSPLIRVLRNKYPDARIDYLTLSHFSNLVEYNYHLNNIYKYSKNFSKNQFNKFIENILDSNKNDKYEFVIDLQNNSRSHTISKRIGKRVLEFKKRRLYKLGLVYLKMKISQYQLIPDLYIETVKELLVPSDKNGLELWLEKNYNEKEYKVNKNSNSRLIIIAAGSAHRTKQYPATKFIELIKQIKRNFDYNIALIGGETDKQICSEIQDALDFEIENYAGKLSLLETAEKIDSSLLVISNDSSAVHIASARGIPVIVIYGSTVPELGFVPYKVPYRIIELKMKCRPCSHIGKSKCPKGHFNCVNLIDNNDIISAMDSHLGLSPGQIK